MNSVQIETLLNLGIWREEDVAPRRREQGQVLDKTHARWWVFYEVGSGERGGCGRRDQLQTSSSSTELAIPVELGQLLFLDDDVVQTTLITGCSRRARRAVGIPTRSGFKEHHSMAELPPGSL